MVTNIFLGIFLLICSVTDIRSKRISAVVLIVFAAAGCVLFFIYRPVSLFEEAAGLLVGTVFIGLSILTEGKVGLGDGLMMLVTGVFLGARENSGLIMTACLFSAFFSLFCLILKKAGRNTELPFAPFILISFIFRRILAL